MHTSDRVAPSKANSHTKKLSELVKPRNNVIVPSYHIYGTWRDTKTNFAHRAALLRSVFPFCAGKRPPIPLHSNRTPTKLPPHTFRPPYESSSPQSPPSSRLSSSLSGPPARKYVDQASLFIPSHSFMA
jgi:hypothetical protein